MAERTMRFAAEQCATQPQKRRMRGGGRFHLLWAVGRYGTRDDLISEMLAELAYARRHALRANLED